MIPYVDEVVAVTVMCVLLFVLHAVCWESVRVRERRKCWCGGWMRYGCGECRACGWYTWFRY